MTVQILLNSQCTLQYFMLSLDNDPTQEPLQVTAEDFGYEIDEQELAEQLMAPLPASLSAPNPPEVTPYGFERIYRWFIA